MPPDDGSSNNAIPLSIATYTIMVPHGKLLLITNWNHQLHSIKCYTERGKDSIRWNIFMDTNTIIVLKVSQIIISNKMKLPETINTTLCQSAAQEIQSS